MHVAQGGNAADNGPSETGSGQTTLVMKLLANNPSRTGARATALLLILCLAIASAAPLRSQEPPVISDPELFSRSSEAALEALKLYGTYENEEHQERLQRIGYAIAGHSGFSKYPFSFFLVDMAIPNAFALPAGHIFVTRGMLDLGLSDDMLAGLLGHEVAHVTEEHFLRMRRRATLLSVLSQVLTVGVLIGASQSDSDTYVDGWGVRRSEDRTGSLVQGVAATGMLVSELLLRSYSRENEDEADEEGQRFAAAAGFDPDGTRQLMAKMEERLPQDQSFGYWQTHPFFEDRVRAARARQGLLKMQDARRVEGYRQSTQKVLLSFADTHRASPELVRLIEDSALAAWPAGAEAEAIRLARLHDLRQEEQSKPALARDYGSLLGVYEEHLEEVAELTPESSFLAHARAEMERLRADRDALYGPAVEILEKGVYETSFLETFLSNFPASPHAPEVALALGEAYARLSRETEAVENLLQAWRTGEGGETAERARRGLKTLAPRLERLAALQSLSALEEDPDLAELARRRLEIMVTRFDELENGAEFLERYASTELTPKVLARQDALADELYKEVILYQRVGDNAKAVQGIHRILTLAPLSDAAKRLGEQAVVDEEKELG